MKFIVFLSGPVGVGKTTLGRALGEKLSGSFIDGDDHSAPGMPWYASILTTSHAVVRTALEAVAEDHPVVIAYPLNCIGWIFYRRKLTEAGVMPIFVTLRASYDSIVSEDRGRVFSAGEKARIVVMISEGYADREFSDLVIDTDLSDFDTTLARLQAAVEKEIAHA